MAKMIVAKHDNGQIEVANGDGGCTITLKFPKT
jgi:hypothetical protein